MEKLQEIHPMVPSYTHHIPVSHGTQQDALNFIEKSIGEEAEGEEEEVGKKREGKGDWRKFWEEGMFFLIILLSLLFCLPSSIQRWLFDFLGLLVVTLPLFLKL